LLIRRESLKSDTPDVSTGMILNVSLGSFRRVLLRMQAVRERQMSVVGGLLVVAGLFLFGCYTMVARSLFIVLRRCVVMLHFSFRDREIRRFRAV